MSRSSLFLIIVAIVTGLAVWAHQSTPYRLGLDVKGGARLTFQMDPEELAKLKDANPAMIQQDLVRIMENRAGAALGVQEGTVAKKGTDQIIVELPGFTDIERARETLGSTAKVQVYHARSVDLGRYSPGGQEGDANAPFIPFTKRTGEILKPGDAEYKQMIEGWDLLLEGGDVTNATPMAQGNGVVPLFNFGGQGAIKLEQMTRRYLNRSPHLAFVLDGRVLSISPVKDGTILKDSAFIDGQFDSQYVVGLTDLIKAGSLPVSLNLIREETVSPTIGNYALDRMIQAGLISFVIIAIFLIVYYAYPGVIAMVGMLLYTLFTLTALKLMNATFSLAAIAGFILSAGMAIDANILVFERLKEEIRNGKTVDKAMRLGFKHALSAIADSNACTIITSLVLVSFGTGAVKGFAITLIMGVVISFITAFFFTRAILTGLYSIGIGRNEKSYALKRAWFGENLEAGADTKTLPIIRKSRTWFLISVALIVPGLIALGMGGIKQNVEFQGGYQAQFVVPQGSDLTVGNAQKKLEDAGFPGANVKFSEYEGKAYVDVTVPAKGAAAASDGQELNAEAKDKLAKALGTTTEGASFSSVGPTVQRETWEGAIKMVVYSTILIVLYLTIRFGIAVGGLKNGIKFGGSAVFALLHDVVFVVGLSAIVGLALSWEISALFLTSMLTVIGFSVHDTIVVFDRIRENLQKTSGNENLETIVDKSVTQTVARSINTSMMTIVQLGILIAIGTPTPDLKFMCVTMLAGIIIGTYSSIFNASPILYIWDKMTMKRKGEGAGLVAEAEREAKLRAQQALAGMQAAPAAAGSTAGVMNPTGQSGAGYATIKRRAGVQPIKKKDEDEE